MYYIGPRSNLVGADLSGHNLKGIDLSNADLCDACLANTNLFETNLEGTYFNDGTEWLDGFDPENAGAIFTEE